jgi:hypothetical protein
VVTNRNSQRIQKIEKLLSKAEEVVAIALKKHADRCAQWIELFLPEARLHAIAVAAIVLSGEPKIDEPLKCAWVRTLRHYNITVLNEYGREFDYENPYVADIRSARELPQAAKILFPAIIGDANETEKLAEIFKKAPVWLLEFTWIRMDASLLHFDLPEMSDKQLRGEAGVKDRLRWPLLPWGMMTDGDPVPDVEEYLDHWVNQY